MPICADALRLLAFAEADPQHIDVEIRGAPSHDRPGLAASTYLIRAAQQGNGSCVALMMMHAQQLGRMEYTYRLDGQGLSALHWAVRGGHTDVVALMKYLDPLVLMQRTSGGLLPQKLITKENKNGPQLRALLSTQKLNNAGSQSQRQAVMSVDTAIFSVMLASISIALCIDFIMSVVVNDSFVLWSNFILQGCIWYFYLNTLVSPMLTVPQQCFHLYQKCLTELYLECTKSSVDSRCNDELARPQRIPNLTRPQRILNLTSSLCHRCHCVLPRHAAHVHGLGHCVMELDHYCIFMKTHIYKENYVWFFGFLLSMSVGMPWFAYCLNYYEEEVSTMIGSLFPHAFKIYTLYAWLCLFGFTICQCVLLLRGITMHEYIVKSEAASTAPILPRDGYFEEGLATNMNTDLLTLQDRLPVLHTFCSFHASPLGDCLFRAASTGCSSLDENSLSCRDGRVRCGTATSGGSSGGRSIDNSCSEVKLSFLHGVAELMDDGDILSSSTSMRIVPDHENNIV